jgi:hypothetical protein
MQHQPPGVPVDALAMRPVESGSSEAEKARAVEQYLFMTNTPLNDQLRFCRERILGCMSKVIEEVKTRGWKVAIKNNHIILPRVKSTNGNLWGRIGLTIGPDTYKLCYVETALLSAVNLNFVDCFGYSNQETKMWLTFEDAMTEVERLLEIYEQLQGVRLWSDLGQE